MYLDARHIENIQDTCERYNMISTSYFLFWIYWILLAFNICAILSINHKYVYSYKIDVFELNRYTIILTSLVFGKN